MKVLYFKNESGDDFYPICIVDRDLSEIEQAKIVAKNIGDDFTPVAYLDYSIDELSKEEQAVGGCICGDWWIVNLENLENASELL
jgi:hypothetical protein